MKLSRSLVPWAFLPALALLLTLPVHAEGDPDLRGMKVGDLLPGTPRTLPGPEGEEVSFPGSGLTIVVFWATWSPRSEEAILHWQKESARLADKGVSFLLVNAENQKMGSADMDEAVEYLRTRGVNLALAFDPELSLYDEIGVIALPTTLFFREDGTLLDYLPGFPSFARDELPSKVDALLGIPHAEEDQKTVILYIPQNNAMMYFGMGKVLAERGMREKAKERLAESLRRDPAYPEPRDLLERLFFKGEAPTAEEKAALKKFLEDAGLPGLADRYREQGKEGL